jgi:hypothetical protein
MNNNIIPTEIINHTIDYLPYYKQLFITKDKYQKINNLYKKNINKIQIFYKNSINRIKVTLDSTNTNQLLHFLNKKDLQTYYILYYPEEYKNDFMKLTLTKIIPLNYNRLNIIYHNNELSLNRKFMNFMRLLQVNEISYVGW